MKIAIDGPAGAGKSTIARLVAKELGLRYLDTGAMYRAITFEALRRGLDLSREEVLVKLITSIDLEIKFQGETGANVVLIDGHDVTGLIREPEVSSNVSLVSSHKKVRELIVALQKEIGRGGSIIMDGRDIGTVVMPDADWKIFLLASVDERAKRRQMELLEQGHVVDLDELKEQIRKRDFLDSTRENSPLEKATGAIEVDTTSLGIAAVVRTLLSLIQEGDHDVQILCCHP